MSGISPEYAANLLWVIWYTTWIAAMLWSAKTIVQKRSDKAGLHRFVLTLGAVLLFLPSAALGPASVTSVFQWLTHKLWRTPDGTSWILFALVAASFAFCWWARLHLGRLWSGFVTLKEGHRIVDTGPYGLVRHPIYSGVIAASLATALMRATPAGLAGFVFIVSGLAMTARIEERFLRAQLGADAYDAYSCRVRMLIPAVW